MAGFLYFIEAKNSLGRAEIEEAGLVYALGRHATPRACAKGPGGGQGIVCADTARVDSGRLKFVADAQTWQKIPSGRAWLGKWNEEEIGPQDLVRPDALNGHELELLDGRKWTVPLARGYVLEDGDLRYFDRLPAALELDAGGRWQPGPVLAKYAGLMALAERWTECRRQAAKLARQLHPELDPAVEDFDEPPAEIELIMDFQDYVAAAINVLAVNYVIGPAEVSMLGLLTDELCVEVLNLMIDLPGRLELAEKKTAPVTPSTSAGSEGSTPDTAPP